jgi:hypothetical protein
LYVFDLTSFSTDLLQAEHFFCINDTLFKSKCLYFYI